MQPEPNTEKQKAVPRHNRPGLLGHGAQQAPCFRLKATQLVPPKPHNEKQQHVPRHNRPGLRGPFLPPEGHRAQQAPCLPLKATQLVQPEQYTENYNRFFAIIDLDV